MLAALLGILTASLAQQDPSWIDRFLGGSRALERGDLPSARADLEAALQILPEHAATAWQLAGACARVGDANEAFVWLERAIDWGGGEAALLAWDPDLSSLRQDQRFAALGERLRGIEAGRKRAKPLLAELACDGGGWSISSSPGADILATGSGGSTFLWDLRAGEILAVLNRPGEKLANVEISPDGRWAVTTGEVREKEHFLRVYDATTGDLVAELADAGWQAMVQFSADGKRMLVIGAQDHGGQVWGTDEWKLLADFPGGSEQAILSPDGRRILQLIRNKSKPAPGSHGSADVSFWDVDQAREVIRHPMLPTIPYSEMGFSSDGSLALVLENQGRLLHVFDGRSGDEIQTIDPGEVVFTSACFLGARGEIAICDKEFHGRIVDARTGQSLREFHINGEHWVDVEASPDGQLILVSQRFHRIEMVDSETGKELWSCGEEVNGIDRARFSPDGSRLLTMDSEDRSSVRDSTSGALLAEVHGPALGANIQSHPRLAELWVVVEDGALVRLDARTGRSLDRWKLEPGTLADLCFPSDAMLVAVLDAKRSLRVIERSSRGERVVTIPDVCGDSDESYDPYAIFSPDGSAILVACSKSSARLHASPTWAARCTLEAGDDHGGWIWSADGKQVAVSSGDDRVILFDARTGERRLSELSIEGLVETYAFEPAGERIWIGTDQSKVHVFDTHSGALVRTLDLADLDRFDAVELGNIAFDREGRLAVTVSSGIGVVAGWRPETGERIWSYSYNGGNPAALECAFGPGEERVYVWGQTQWTPRIVDAASGRTLLDLGEGGKWALVPLADEALVGVHCDEGFEVLDSKSGMRLWNRLELAGGNWLLNAPSRHVDSTREALESLHLVLPERSYPLDALAAALLDPKKVRAAAEGITIAPAELPPIPELQWAAPQSRVIRIASSEPALTISLEASCPDGVSGFEVLRNGERSRLEGELVDTSHRRLVLTPDRLGDEPLDLRFRAISSRGILSRALHLTIEALP